LPESSVEIGDIAESVDGEEAFDVPDYPLDPAFFIGFAGIAGADGEAVVPGKVQESRILSDLRLSVYDYGFEIVVSVPAYDAADFLQCLYMAVKKELQGTPHIEATVKIS